MICEHCKSNGLSGKFFKSNNRTKKYFRYCKCCGYNSYYSFPNYLDESQFDKYLEHASERRKR